MTSLSSHSTWLEALRKSLPRLRKSPRSLLHKEASWLLNLLYKFHFWILKLLCSSQLGRTSWRAISCWGMHVLFFVPPLYNQISNSSDIDFGCTEITWLQKLVPVVMQTHQTMKLWRLVGKLCHLQVLLPFWFVGFQLCLLYGWDVCTVKVACFENWLCCSFYVSSPL